MRGGQTTVIQHVLEKRAQQPPALHEDTTATIAVMLRVLPPPAALLAISDPTLRAEFQRRIMPDSLDYHVSEDEREALEMFQDEFRPVVVTDSLELIRQVRSQQGEHAPFIIFLAEIDEAPERELGYLAGADECLARRVSEHEFNARIATARRVVELEGVLRVTLAENRKLSTTDDLTKVASRRFFSKHFPREVERATRYKRPLSLILCDIDFFKRVNDTLGHAAGDQILKQFAARLQAGLRRGVDWVARLGGEEFAVVLPETDYEQALDVARKLRASVANKPFSAQGRKLEITASFGLCGINLVPQGSERRIPQHILKVADEALYKSKNSGRNRVTATLLSDD